MQIVEFKFRLTKQLCTTIKWWILTSCNLRRIFNKLSKWFKSAIRSNPWTELPVQSDIRKTILVRPTRRKRWLPQDRKTNSKLTSHTMFRTITITRGLQLILIWWACIRPKTACSRRLQPSRFKRKETIIIHRWSTGRVIFPNSASSTLLQTICLWSEMSNTILKWKKTLSALEHLPRTKANFKTVRCARVLTSKALTHKELKTKCSRWTTMFQTTILTVKCFITKRCQIQPWWCSQTTEKTWFLTSKILIWTRRKIHKEAQIKSKCSLSKRTRTKWATFMANHQVSTRAKTSHSIS